MELMQYQASDTDGEILSFLSWSFLSLNRKSKSTKRWQGGNQSVRDAAFMDSLEDLKVGVYNIFSK